MAKETEPEGTIVKDAELKAINRLFRDLSVMNFESRKRSLAYVLARFGWQAAADMVSCTVERPTENTEVPGEGSQGRGDAQ